MREFHYAALREIPTTQTLSEMNLTHQVILAIDIFVGLLFLTIWLPDSKEFAFVWGTGMFLSYFAHVATMIFSMILLVIMLYHVVKRDVTEFLQKHWLGIINGPLMLFSWWAFFYLADFKTWS